MKTPIGPAGRKTAKHLARRTSPSAWLGDFSCLDSDEAIMFGPVYRQDATAYGETITHALYGRVKRVAVTLLLRRGLCTLVRVAVDHNFWRRKLVFDLPPMKASEAVEHVWSAITVAMSRANVDPVSLSRERLSHGPREEDPDSDSFSLVLAAWAEE